MVRIERWKVQRQMQQVGIRTFKELAERAEVAPQTVSAWFRGAGFSSEMLTQLCTILECEPGDILTFDPNPKAPVVEGEKVLEPKGGLVPA